MPSSQYNVLKKKICKDFFFFKSKIRNCKILKNPFDNFFFKLNYCPKSSLQDYRVLRCFTGANSRKGSFEIVCCHGNSLQHTHINEKEIPGVLLIFTLNARSLNPKLKQKVHF